MSQHDYVLDNAAGAPFRADINSVLGAIATQNKGPTAPATTYPGMPWFDDVNGLQKYRNAANTAWVLDSLSAASRGSVAMHATTMDLWALPQISDGTGSPVTITAIANAPHPSARRTLYPITGTTITNGATFAVDGAANYTTAAGDALEFEAVTVNTYKVHITKKDGTAIVASSSGRRIAQIQTFATGAVATGTTTIPNDDTIPQNTEGDQYLSVSITPQSALSTLEIESIVFFGSTTNAVHVSALFQDSIANALVAGQTFPSPSIASVFSIPLRFQMTSGTTSTTTFKVRLGAAAAATITLNGLAGARLMGGVMGSRITVTEYLP